MKLLMCKNCGDVYSLATTTKECCCGKSSGKYLDNIRIEYTGDVFVLGFSNPSLMDAIRNHSDDQTMSTEFISFIIPKNML